ncbi:hydantoinase/oxoprolinase family protein [Nakamurella sp. YIM 132087]|uniref:Hydantoinase/oxoprolinase family protein n=1 Tax=Nakamurella alba TaxID=2665158 RepID=A0A7K1FF87_9ACTN|nr:hydantoinase/oxoprolinase family protein [Nakamurella alba]MTD12772.1 hydantoinase/oxoprolinase family protein [Nakamurella alba]
MPASVDLRIGIDVGGTNTDAVVLDRENTLLAKFKTPTTPDLTSGISLAIESVLAGLDEPVERITHVMLGTTHATNAILERRDLYKVAVVRIGAPATTSIPPLLDWPADLAEVVSAGDVVIRGGSEISGDPLTDFDADALAQFLRSVQGTAQAVAVTGVFSPVSAEHEFLAEKVVHEVLGDIPVSLSHGIGALGLLERENACVLNAALVGVARKVVAGLTESLQRNKIDAVSFLTQNDGTLMGLDYVLRFPVLTIGSGPANSMRGAGYLTNITDGVVVDVGGTSSDIGILINGFPRESSTAVDIGGVRTNFRMPDLVSIAVGGGTRIRATADGITVGPDSVGYRLRTEALVFGGGSPTLSDAAVAAGRMSIGDPEKVAGREETLKAAQAEADDQVWNAIDQIRPSRMSVPVVAVGGGSLILPKDLPGFDDVLWPENYDVANAIGAAIASVSGQVDKVFKLGNRTREEILAEATTAASDEAVSAGADPDEVEIVEIEEVPMAYLQDPVVRIRAKAAGPLGAV